MQPTHRPCVSVVIFRPSSESTFEVLLVHKPRKNDAWQVPQGGIEEGETPEGAAARELLEETGISLAERPVLHPEFYQYDYPEGFKLAKKPKYTGQRLAFVTASVSRETVVTVDKRELDTFKWVTPAEIGKYLKRKNYLKVVEKVILSLGQPAN